MDEPYLYRKIAESIRQEILDGSLKPGDRLAPVREMAATWSCTPGTIQHAYQELARQGLVVSRAGQGTRVVEKPLAALHVEAPLRPAALVNRAEAFLLEVLTAGYSLAEADQAVHQAMDRWRTIEQEAEKTEEGVLRFVGSHDLAVTWLASHFNEIQPGYRLQASFTGSLGGLIALANGQADLAGSHLWDEESDTYNIPYVRRIFPGRRVALLTLAHRRLGLILPPGNPAGILGLEDLKRRGIRFANRQSGSGTRVWLDAALHRAGIRVEEIRGYTNEKNTHSAVARAIAEGQADAGIGLEGSARSYGLDFVLLLRDRYDLVMYPGTLESPPAQALAQWLQDGTPKKVIESLGGYDTEDTGKITWVE
jgi:molybdate-binding protein/DNA-binding transcriptional regulator YhcF (GntR family)